MKKSYLLLGFCGLLISNILSQSAAAQNTRLDPTFQLPVITNGTSPGTVNDVVRQADGKYIIGGSFTSINGVRARNLARLNANGTLDASFTANSTANGAVYALDLQPDGSILVGGQFDSLATGRRRSVGRLLPAGSLDTGFDANLTATLAIRQVAALPGGDVLMLEPRSIQTYGTPVVGLYRLNGQTGQVDTGFQQAVMANCFAVQPDGKIVTGGSGVPYNLVHALARLLPTGGLDPFYAPRTSTGVYTSQVGVEPSGIYHLGSSPNGYTYSGLSGPGISSGSSNWGSLGASRFAVQPNGRILVAGTNTANVGLSARLLASGQNDGGYTADNGPRADANGRGQLMELLVQPDGAVMMAGSFTLAGTTPVWGLVRMLDANVLAARNELAEKNTAAWPVPASEILHVQFETSARPQQVQLLDGLGRAVLTQPVAVATAKLALDVAALPAGIYTLRVSYAQDSPVVRRVVLRR